MENVFDDILIKMFCGKGKYLVTETILCAKKNISVIMFPSLSLIQNYLSVHIDLYTGYNVINISSEKLEIHSTTDPDEIHTLLSLRGPKLVLVTYPSYDLLIRSLQGLRKPTSEIDNDKQRIITVFNKCVKGVEICLEGQHVDHCGKEGHWLETQMGITHNSKNEPDVRGFELKKDAPKITLGDFSASEYAFSGKNKRNSINTLNNWPDDFILSRSEFIKIFGNPNPRKGNRYSWSGRCVPTYNHWNFNGQMLTINERNDIIIYYSFSNDTRSVKIDFPLFLQNDNIVIALWKSSKMKPHIENKFDKNGFFLCKKIGSTYGKICFGKAFNFDYFIECIKNKKIIFDSGMYDGNSRNYSQFRGTSCFWNELIIEEY